MVVEIPENVVEMSTKAVEISTISHLEKHSESDDEAVNSKKLQVYRELESINLDSIRVLNRLLLLL